MSGLATPACGPGDEVYGLIQFDRDDAAAECVAVPAANLAPRPDRRNLPLAEGRAAFESGRKPDRRSGKTFIVVRG